MIRSVRTGLFILTLLLLAACGTPATPAALLAPTDVLPTRVAILPTTQSGTLSTTGVVASTATVAPTLVPAVLKASATPTITLIPPTPTRPLATATLPPTAAPPTKAVSSSAGAGDVKAGAVLFQNTGNPSIPACSTCHYVDKPDILVGPSQQGLATRAGSRVPGQDAATYIRHSILNPNEYIVPNEGAHIYGVNGQSLMYQNYAKDLTPQQVDDLVAYLLTLK